MAEEITVAELFAGVGGFRLGLEGHPDSEKDTGFKVVFSNQWEPPSSTQKNPPKQWASMIYELRFGKEGHVNEDIENILNDVPNHDLLVGGFPCQDYSVARTISGELGIEGEKGKLWTSIRHIIENNQPKMILLENVPRLLTSPSKKKGLNFAKIGADLLNLGYDFEWRVINAGDYGMPQRRRRVFIIAYHSKITPMKNFKQMETAKAVRWLTNSGPFATKFPIHSSPNEEIICTDWPRIDLIDEDKFTNKQSPFKKAGLCFCEEGGKMLSFNPEPIKEPINPLKKHLLNPDDEIYNQDYLVTKRLDYWDYVKGQRKEFRIRRKDQSWAENINVNAGKHRNLWSLYRYYMEDIIRWKNLTSSHKAIFEEHLGTNHGVYRYSEGKIGRDDVTRPSRTIVTAEIGKSPARSRHLFEFQGVIRRLQPIECERLNQFPDDWTNIEGITDSRRGFLMGNALVVGVIERLRESLRKLITENDL